MAAFDRQKDEIDLQHLNSRSQRNRRFEKMIGGNPTASFKKNYHRTSDQRQDEAEIRDEVALSMPPPPFLSNESRINFLKYALPLYQAAMDGDWETANIIFNEAPQWITAPITKRSDTALHIATAAKHNEFIRKLVDRMVAADDRLESRNQLGNTAFHIAASSGTVDIAKVMLARNMHLPNIRGSQAMFPLQLAIYYGNKYMVKFLGDVTDYRLWDDDERVNALTSAIEADLYEFAFRLIRNYPHLALCRNRNDETVLHTLAQKPMQNHTSQKSILKSLLSRWTNFPIDEGQYQLELALQVTQIAWIQVIKLSEDEISEIIAYPFRLLFVAAITGNVEFLITLILSYPDVMWKVDEQNRSIFHIAIIYRHVEIFKLIHEIGAIKDIIATYTDVQQNNMLHLAAKIAPPDRLNCVSGAALQMQRELLWFEAVKSVVLPHHALAVKRTKTDPESAEETIEYRESIQALFTEEHKTLRLQGEEWMKKTAESCTLVAALIATVVFTAAFTLPGGNDDKDGSPILLKEPAFKVFAISNAVSLFASANSILMFLSILTSRYAERDFLKVLPVKLMIGLSSLFISIAGMMVAFSATFFLTFKNSSIWIPTPIVMLAAIPVLLFAFQQYPLLWDIYNSTYRTFKPNNPRRLTWKNKGLKRKSS